MMLFVVAWYIMCYDIMHHNVMQTFWVSAISDASSSSSWSLPPSGSSTVTSWKKWEEKNGKSVKFEWVDDEWQGESAVGRVHGDVNRAVVSCVVLHYTDFYCFASNDTHQLNDITVFYTKLHYTVSRHISMQCFTSYHITFHHTALYHIAQLIKFIIILHHPPRQLVWPLEEPLRQCLQTHRSSQSDCSHRRLTNSTG